MPCTPRYVTNSNTGTNYVLWNPLEDVPDGPDPELERLIAEEADIESRPRRWRDGLSITQHEITNRVVEQFRLTGPTHFEQRTPRPQIRNTSMNYQFITLNHGLGPYSEYITKARGFFATHGDRRYSSSSLNRLEGIEFAIRNDMTNQVTCPALVVADDPIVFDPETESKTGGLLGMAVCWPMERVMVAVNRAHRQQGIGSDMVQRLSREFGRSSLTLWVGQNNVAGHRFCLHNGFIPTAMNGGGAVRYAVGTEDV
jgi:hypothetical protein